MGQGWKDHTNTAPSEGEVVDVWVSAQADDAKVRPAERITNAFAENGVWHYTDFSGCVHRIWRKVTHWRAIPDAPRDVAELERELA